jgi:hypothetical protein
MTTDAWHAARKTAIVNNYPREVLKAFGWHLYNAKYRNIAFNLTIEEWWQWWQIDDRWSRRGNRGNDLVMARFNDQGPYSLSNVYCATSSQNLQDKSRGEPRRKFLLLRIEPKLKAALQAAAAADGRTLSDMVHRILAEWLRRQGQRKS